MQIINIVFIFGFYSVILADNSCRFEHTTKGVINLSAIGLRNGQARFQNLLPSSVSSYIYSFNPCYSFSENTCENAAVCQISSDGMYSFMLARQNASKWTIDANDNPVLTYTYGSKIVSITMICSATVQDTLEVIGEDKINHYSMRLQSRCACWNKCVSPVPTVTTSRTPPATTHTVYSSACRYQDSQYGTIDLSSIGNINGKPTFKDVPSMHPNNYVWSYNPCYKFTEDSCYNVAGCQIDKTRKISYTIGLQENVYWINMTNKKNVISSIVYTSTSPSRRLSVQLICDRSLSTHHLQVLGEVSVGEYAMQLTSRCACWNGCVKPTPKPEPKSFDSNFWIIASIIGGVVFLLVFLMITCLFCSKPKRRYPLMFVNEKTPIMNGKINYHS